MIALTNLNNFNMYHFCSLLTSLKALIKWGWLCSLVFVNGRYFNISFKIHSLILGIFMTLLTYLANFLKNLLKAQIPVLISYIVLIVL